MSCVASISWREKVDQDTRQIKPALDLHPRSRAEGQLASDQVETLRCRRRCRSYCDRLCGAAKELGVGKKICSKAK